MKKLRCGRLGLLGFGLGLFVSGCDFSNNGLGAGGEPGVDPGRAGSGAGGTSGRGGSSGAVSGGTSAGTAMPPAMMPTMPPPPMDITPPPPPTMAPVDAAPDSTPVSDDGSSGIQSIDAAPAADTSPPPPPAASACPADADLLLCLDFEGAVSDQSPPAASVTVRSVAFEAGPTGQAVRFSSDSQIALPSGVGLGAGAFTVEAWLRPDGLPTGMQRAGVMDKQGHFGLFVLPGGDVVCYSQGAMATAASAARVGQWISASCTVGGGTVGVWINGVRRDTAPEASGAPAGEPAIAVGSNSPSGDPFNGLLDNVRVWAGARSAAQICPLAYSCN